MNQLDSALARHCRGTAAWYFQCAAGRRQLSVNGSAFELIEDESACFVPGHIRLCLALVSVRRMRIKVLGLVAKTLLFEAAPITRS